jgi:uncharacterized protein YabE (DUF348 family)
MKFHHLLGVFLPFYLFSCQPNLPTSITILDGEKTYSIESKERVPLTLLLQAGITPQPTDRIYLNGILLPIDKSLPPTDFIQLQLRRAYPLTIITPKGQQAVESAARTVGQAVEEAGFQIYASDFLDPPANSPITGPISITYTPAGDMSIFVGGKVIRARSASGNVEGVLAEAGVPLIGLDISSPPENEAPPPDGQIRVVRVSELVDMAINPIPFATQIIDSPDVPVGQQKTIQPGLNGLKMVRTRLRYEDGKEVSRKAEGESTIREPQARIVGAGSQVVLAPVPAGGVPNDYWLALQMYATVYSPCQSGTGGCSYSTASGAPAGKGIVAVDYSIYSYLAGMRVYIPGYGIATIGDTGGGPIIETKLNVPRTRWIDLGFNEGQIVDMTGWVTVYFLAPAPAEIPTFLK